MTNHGRHVRFRRLNGLVACSTIVLGVSRVVIIEAGLPAQARQKMPVSFVVTGFSTFPGCPQNPTELLVQNLAAQLKQRMSASIEMIMVLYRFVRSGAYGD